MPGVWGFRCGPESRYKSLRVLYCVRDVWHLRSKGRRGICDQAMEFHPPRAGVDEPPKVPGCYLGRKKGGRISMVIYCFYQKDELGFWNGKKFCTFEQDATEYFGPIPEPREPKE